MIVFEGVDEVNTYFKANPGIRIGIIPMALCGFEPKIVEFMAQKVKADGLEPMLGSDLNFLRWFTYKLFPEGAPSDIDAMLPVLDGKSIFEGAPFTYKHRNSLVLDLDKMGIPYAYVQEESELNEEFIANQGDKDGLIKYFEGMPEYSQLTDMQKRHVISCIIGRGALRRKQTPEFEVIASYDYGVLCVQSLFVKRYFDDNQATYPGKVIKIVTDVLRIPENLNFPNFSLKHNIANGYMNPDFPEKFATVGGKIDALKSVPTLDDNTINQTVQGIVDAELTGGAFTWQKVELDGLTWIKVTYTFDFGNSVNGANDFVIVESG